MKTSNSFSARIIKRTSEFSVACDNLGKPEQIFASYNPLSYAFKPHSKYLQKFANGPKKALFLGMNPGPWGMVQTGVPFGEVDAVRNWLRIEEKVQSPINVHPARPITGFECTRSEVSGKRLWGLFADCFGSSDSFFEDNFVLNYCPLSFMSKTGANITPDKLPIEFRKKLNLICDEFLRFSIEVFQPEQVIGIGGYATKCFQRILPKETQLRIGTILHPSPASPIANKEWPSKPKAQLKSLGVL
jgi:single-strand selective monofunctional uracil DNA glycosylase